MPHVASRLVPFSMLAGLLLAGCAHQPAARSGDTASNAHSATTTPETGSVRPHPAVAARSAPRIASKLPEQTGIPACDDYLASYMACHRAAQIFTPDQLPARYEAMRTSLLRDSMNPDIRPQLAARCNSLATQLRQALHGKACDVEPAPGSSTH